MTTLPLTSAPRKLEGVFTYNGVRFHIYQDRGHRAPNDWLVDVLAGSTDQVEARFGPGRRAYIRREAFAYIDKQVGG